MRKSNKGFTIIELIVSLALLALILVPVAGFFTNSFKIQSKSSMKTSITRVGQYVMENFKNKNYLGLTVDDLPFESYIQEKGTEKKQELETETEVVVLKDSGKVNVTGADGWDFPYNGVDYKITIELNGLTESDIKNLEIPEESECDGVVEIDESGTIFGDARLATCNEGASFRNPINNTDYTASCPTIILNGTYSSGSDATLWITNRYKEDDGSWNKVRIIKVFDEKLHVYVEGNNISILKGLEGDGASAAQTRITSSYIGGVEEGNTERSSSEVLLDATMVISNKNDDTIRDTFTFSFPVNYDY